MQKSGVNITERLMSGGPQVSGNYPLVLVGLSERGPDGLSQPMSSLEEFEATYGRVPVAGSYSNDAVYQYTRQRDGESDPGNFYFVRATPAGYILAQMTVKALTVDKAVDTLDALRYVATGKGKWGAKVRVIHAPSTAGDANRINVTVRLYDAEASGAVVQEEVYENVYFRPSDRQNAKFIENVINSGSAFVRVTVLADAPYGVNADNGTEKSLINVTADAGVLTRDEIMAAVNVALPQIKGVKFLYVPDAFNVPDSGGASPTFGALVTDLIAVAAKNAALAVVDTLETDSMAQATTKVTALAGKSAAVVNLRWGYTGYRQSVAVPLSAAWIGLYSARANNPDKGLHYPASNLPLNGVVSLKAMAGIKLEDARSNNINVFMELDGGGYGLHGLWTPDKDADGFRQVSRRLVWWDIQLKVRTALSGLMQNTPLNAYTLKKIEQRIIAILSGQAVRGVLVGKGGKAASRGDGYDWGFDTSNQAELNKGNASGVLTVRDSATAEQLTVVMSNYNDYLQ